MATTTGPDFVEPIDLGTLERSLRQPRSLFSGAMSILTGLMTAAALVPLFSVLYLLVVRGGRQLSLALFTELPPAALTAGGGFGNAIVGTVIMVAIAAALSVPVGILAAVFIAEFGSDTRTAAAVRFSAKVLTGLPSILAGVFAYAAVVVVTGGFSAPAGGIALALLMLPTVLLTAEEAIKRVPPRMREAAVGMGATPTQVVWSVVLPTALPGLLTGVMLAVARAAGETAPLLFTALFSDFWVSRSAPAFLPKVPAELMKPTASLAVLIYNFSSSPFDNQIELAWAAALVLVTIVLLINLAGQTLAKRSQRR
jgi:phosphate transport system permease protein